MESGDWEWFHKNIQDLVGTDDFPLPRTDCCRCMDLVERFRDTSVAATGEEEWFRPTYTEFLKFILKDYPEMIPDGDVENFMEREIVEALIGLKEVCKEGEDGYGHNLRDNNIMFRYAAKEEESWRDRWTEYSVDSTLVKDMIKGTYKMTPPAPLPKNIADTIPRWGVKESNTAQKQMRFEGPIIDIENRIDYLREHTKQPFYRENKKINLIQWEDLDENFYGDNWLTLYRNDKRKRKFSTGRSLSVDVRENKSSISVNTEWRVRTWEKIENGEEGGLWIKSQTLHWRPTFTCPWFGKVVMVNRATNTIAATFYYYFSHLYNEDEMHNDMGKNLKRYIEYACNDELGRGFGHASETTEEDLQEFLERKKAPSHYSSWDEWLNRNVKQAQEQAFYETNAPTVVKVFIHEPEIVGQAEGALGGMDGSDNNIMLGRNFYSLHPWLQLFSMNTSHPFYQFRYFTQYDSYIGMLNEKYAGAGCGMLNWEW